MKTDLRPAYYALPSGAWRDYLTLLHLPYSVWHLSYVVIGAAAAPVVHLDRLAALMLAFFLAVGLAAHALDEFRGRPLRTGLSDASLLSIAIVSLAGALLIGVLASLVVSLWAVPFVIFGGLIVPAYNLEMLGGREIPFRPLVRVLVGCVPRRGRVLGQRRASGCRGPGAGRRVLRAEPGPADPEQTG